MQQIVACKVSIADPKARYHDLLLPEGGVETHSYYHDLPATSSESERSDLPEQCRTIGASVYTRGAEFSVRIQFCTE